jgi:hypothetical protein
VTGLSSEVHLTIGGIWTNYFDALLGRCVCPFLHLFPQVASRNPSPLSRIARDFSFIALTVWLLNHFLEHKICLAMIEFLRLFSFRN